MEMLEVDLNSVKLYMGFFLPSLECLHRFCCLDPSSDTFICQLVLFFMDAFA